MRASTSTLVRPSAARRMPLALALALALVLPLLVALGTTPPAVAAVPSGFREVTAFSGLVNPTAVRFAPAPDTRIFVAEKRGTIQMYDSLTDTSPTQVADLRTEVYNFWDRGLLGLAVDPGFPAKPYLYALYTFDGPIGGSAPVWGKAGEDGDPCADPTGAGCVVSGKLVKLTLTGAATGAVTGSSKQDLVHDWCQQYPSHSIGDLVFDSKGALLVSAGDGASFDWVDYGQQGNVCNDPAGAGGALRSQDLRTSGDPVTLDGTVIRVSPETGAPLPDNPGSAATDANAKRIIATGLRNPFRMSLRPGTDEVWLGDVGWSTFEEINRVPAPSPGSVPNFGWPCYEGNDRQGGYEAAGLDICKGMYTQGTADTKPYFAYRHGQALNASDNCNTTRGSSASGLSFSFYSGGPYPAEYDGALFFADYSRNCIWVMTKGTDGLPDKLKTKPFVSQAKGPTDLELSPTGELFYTDFNGGTVQRVVYGTTPPPPASCPSGQYRAEYFPNKTLTGPAAATACEAAPLAHDWGTGAPAGVGPDNFSARWSGTFEFAAGEHDFTAVTDDGIRVWVDDQLLIDQWQDQEAVYRAARTLTAGSHTVRVEWFETGGAAVAKLNWATTATPTGCPEGQYLAQYFPNKTLTGPAASTACEPAPLAHDWGTGAPQGVGPDNFSARWSGKFSFPTTSTYDFTISTDDGIRVWVDDTLVLDQWQDQHTDFTASRAVTAGVHDVRVEWFETGTDAVAKVSWAARAAPANAPPQPVIAAPAEGTRWKVGDLIAFSGSASDPEDGPLPASALSWQVVIQHCEVAGGCHAHPMQTWSGSGGSFTAPDHEHPSHLELSLTATDSRGGTSTVTRRLDPQTVDLTMASVPSGLQLTLGDITAVTPFTRTVIAGSVNSVSAVSPQTLSGTSYEWASWSDGQSSSHNINAGTTASTLTATYSAKAEPPPPPPTCTSGRYLAEYFPNKTLSGAPAVTGCEAAPLEHDWGTGAPTGVGPDNFSARWTGSFDFTAGTYDFTAVTDDGIRVWIDGQLQIDQWQDQNTTFKKSLPITAGTHTVKIEWFETGGGAIAKFAWAPSPPPGSDPTSCPDGQFRAEYFVDRALSGAVASRACETTLDKNWGAGGPPGTGVDNFSARWTGRFTFPAGTRNFSASWDDGMRVYIDGVRVLDRWKGGGTATFSRSLTAGVHEIKVEYYEKSGSASARLSWS